MSTVEHPTQTCQVLTDSYPDPIPGIIPFRTVTIIAGAAGVGKTAMIAEWCRRWRDGLTICGKPTHPPTAFYYFAADRQWQSHQLWFDAVGFGDIPHYSLADDHSFDLKLLKQPQEAWQAFLYGFNKLLPIPGSHLFVDPSSPLFISGDPNRPRDVAVSMLRFSRLCQERQINITCTAHFSKQKGDPKEQYTRPQDRIAGSGAFAGFSDTQIYLIDPVQPKQNYHILGWVPRHDKPEEFKFKREEKTGLFVPYELYDDLSRREAALAAVPETPTETHLIIERIRQATNLSRTQAEEYFYILVKDGRITKIRRGIYQQAKPC